ncbi:MAG: GNAT family N-acetyltransferase [Chloroflexota bacterium]
MDEAAPINPPIITIRGEKVALGPVSREVIVPLGLKWLNDLEVTRTLGVGASHPLTLEAEEVWYDRASRSETDVIFLVYEQATLRVIGSTGLHHVDHFNRTAEFGILIGEKDCWGKGYGTETARLMLDYAFNVLGLHNVMLKVFSYNQRGIRAYTRAGFKVIGHRREAHRFGGRAFDEILMDCLSTEFQGSTFQALLPDG